MIVQQNFRLVDVVRAIWKPLLTLLILDCVVTVAYVGLGWTWIGPHDLPLPLIGTGLAVFLGLRNNNAYARWWEARTLWGAVTNHSRNFARTVMLLFPGERDGPTRQALIEHQIAWAHALRSRLRKEDAAVGLRTHLPHDVAADLETEGNVPFTIQRSIADLLSDAQAAGRIDSMQAIGLNTTLNALADAQGGLERIATTPMPRQYASFPRLFVALYCVLLPFGVVADLGILTPVGSTIIGFLFLALDSAGRNLEDPFARSVHEVPMSAITRTIEIDLKQTLGRDDRPVPLRPVRGILR